MVATAYKKVTMISSTHIWTLSSLRRKGLHFLLSRINKLNCDFFHVCPLKKPRYIAAIPSVLNRVQKMVGIVNKGCLPFIKNFQKFWLGIFVR